MVVLRGDMGVGSGGIRGWLCTRRGELEIGPDFGPSSTPLRAPRTPQNRAFWSPGSINYGERLVRSALATR